MEKKHRNERTYAVGEYEYGTQWRLSWGSIFCGLFVTLTIFLTLHFLGAGIGISTLDIQDTADNPQASSLGIGAGIWWFICGLISLFAGGWIAGYLANTTDRIAGALHGLVVWSLMYLVMFWVVTIGLASIVGGAIGVIGKTLSGAGQVASTQQGQQILSQTMKSAGIDVNAVKQNFGQTPEVTKSIQDYMQGNRTPQERQKLVQSVSQSTGKSPQEVNRIITEMEQQAEQAKETGQQAIKITGGSLIGLAIVMLIGAVSAVVGAIAGTPKYFERTSHTTNVTE